MKKRGLWWIFGPVIIAFVLAGALFLAPFSLNHIPQKSVRNASVSFSKNVYKGETVKTAAFSDPSKRYVPFFGSSELLRLDTMHPSMLAAKYNRNYQPFLLGQAGTESLLHYLSMQEMLPALHKKQAVFVISQQWFVKKNVHGAFSVFYSTLMTVDWLRNIKEITPTDRYIAKQLLEQPQIKDNVFYVKLVTKIKDNQPLSQTDLNLLSVRHRALLREDELFSNLTSSNNWDKHVKPAISRLPATDENGALFKEATKIAARETANNPFKIKDSFYRSRIQFNLKRLADSQKKFDYRQSQQYADLQAVLAEFARQKTDVLFVIQPVNQRWANYTGLSNDMYYQSVDKVKKQLTSQGFNKIADLSHDGAKNYFMQDTIHLGWNGWVTADEYIKSFLEGGYKPTNYHINNNYLSKEWQNLMPTAQNLQQFK